MRENEKSFSEMTKEELEQACKRAIAEYMQNSHPISVTVVKLDEPRKVKIIVKEEK